MGMGLGDNESLNFKLGEEQVDRLYLGSAYVWPNVPIADVVATDGLVGLVTITWSDTNEVAPNTFDVYADDVKIATNVTSPHDYTIDESTKMYSVRGLYGGGHFIGSNEDSGTSLSGLIPGPITDFNASDNRIYEVQSTWSDASGDPVPVYDLYEDGGIVAQGVSSGHIQASAVGTRPWHVVARNAEGETPSNTNNGTALDIPISGSVNLDIPGTFQWCAPEGVSSVTMTITGAGGGGGGHEVSSGVASAGGGNPGHSEGAHVISVNPGECYTYTIGSGGTGCDPNASTGSGYCTGAGGGSSSMFGVTMLGGNGANSIDNPVEFMQSPYFFTAYGGGTFGPFSVGGAGMATISTGVNAGDGSRGGGGGGLACAKTNNGFTGRGGDGHIYLEWG